MKKVLFLLLIVTFLIIILVTVAFPTHSLSKEMDEVEELKREITLLNLINGLNLTDSQSEKLLKYTKEAKAVRDSAERGYNIRFNAALTELRNSLYDKNSRPPQDIERHAAELNRREKEKKEEMIRQLKDIEAGIKSALTPGQIEIVNNFKPCLIPPKDMRNPVKAGQAFDSSPAERLIERARSTSDKRYTVAKQRIADEYIKRLESHIGSLTESEKEAKRELLLETIDKSRRMSDQEFALSKKELAMRISQERERNEIKKKLDLTHSRKDLGPIGKYLLDAKVIPILEKRLEASKGQGHTGSSGLSNINVDSMSKTCSIKTL